MGDQNNTMTPYQGSEPTGSRRQIVVMAVLALAIAGAIQYYTSYPFDADTAYHAAVGQLIRDHGILYSFPWTPFSTLADHYADKELLFHLFFVPLTGLSFVTAAKIVGTFSGGILLLSFYLVLRAERVRFAGVWALLPLAASGYFFFRFALVRPFVLSIALTVVMLWAYSRRRYGVLAVCSVLFPWLYVAFWQLPLLLLIAAETARLLSGERIEWKPAAVTAAGVMLGVLVHPNSANLAHVNWVNMTEMFVRNTLEGRTGFSMGQELEPFTAIQWGKWLAVSTAMTALSSFLCWDSYRKGKLDATTLAFTFAALGFGVLTVKSAKFEEYFVPFSALAAALATRTIPFKYIPQAVLAVALIYTATFSIDSITVLSKRGVDIEPGIEAELQRLIPPGSQVFTSEWLITGPLMVMLPERRFIVGLDPTFFYAKDPELYKLWYDLPRVAPEGAAKTIRDRFGAHYVVLLARPEWQKFLNRLSGEPGVRILLMTSTWMVFYLGDV
jgi:hypothetical protein